MIADHRLDFWLKNNLNVLFTGHAGVGKTTIVKNAIERNKLKWVYFSAATLDPWIDLCGCPREMKDENGKAYLDLVRPAWCKNDDIDIIFFDELNRSSSKVRNSVLELIQFKSINGKKFENLKMVWAAINPDDENEEMTDGVKYDVERLDQAIKDRFQIQVDIPYKPYLTYFKGKFDMNGIAACEWWNELPKEMKLIVSPRRLDYALEVFAMNGDIRDVLPAKSNVSKLITLLNIGPVKKKLETFLKDKNVAEAEEFFKVENQYNSAISYILPNRQMLEFFAPLFDKERIAQLIATDKRAFTICCTEAPLNSNQKIMEVCREIKSAKLNQKLINKINSASIWKNILTEDRKNNPQSAQVASKLTGDQEKDLFKILQNLRNISIKPVISGVSDVTMAIINGNISQLGLNGTYRRKQLMEFLSVNVPNNAAKQDILNILKTINDCMDQTQIGFFIKSPWTKIITEVLPYYLWIAIHEHRYNFKAISNTLSSKRINNMLPIITKAVEKNVNC